MLNTENSSANRIKTHIENLFHAAQKLEQLKGCQIVEKPTISEVWLVTSNGIFLRKICGHRGVKGPCLLSAGYNTNHTGKGKCKRHGRSLLYNPQLNVLEGIPSKFGELLEHVDGIEDGILLNVDHELKFFYALQQYVLF